MTEIQPQQRRLRRYPDYETKFTIILSQCAVLFLLNMTNLTTEFFDPTMGVPWPSGRSNGKVDA